MQDPSAESIVTPAPAAAAAPPKPSGGVKETIEQILIAFILAFIFRAFIVEAFVIPTGSMATTLLGAHMRFACPDCGYNFDVNYSNGNGNDDSDVPSNAGPLNSPVFCPNCGFRMDPGQTENPPVFYGDRILVLKYLYLFQHPQRWDVVVFKAPYDPQRYNYSQNYIKRLVGRPGESLMVLDGDIYVKPPGESRFVVQTKTPEAQNALWRLVYNNDYRPQRNLDRGEYPNFKLPWTPVVGTGWNLDEADHGRTFTCAADANGSAIAFDPTVNPTSQNVSDYLAYDQPTPSRRPNEGFPAQSETPDSDLDLRATYQRTAGDGPLELRLTKRDHTFIAQLTPTQVSLFHQLADGQRKLIGAASSLSVGSRNVRVELSNADYQVTLRIDDRVVAQTTTADYAPDFDELRHEYVTRLRRAPAPRVEVSAQSQQCRLSHVSLWRDVFYYNRGGQMLSGTPDSPAVLGDDEYFVCGDNSLVSLDARYWPDPIHLPDENLDVQSGRVPGRFLLGKAFFVYWPAGFRPINGFPNLIPNFADMRFIH